MLERLTNREIACVGCFPVEDGFEVAIVTLEHPLPEGAIATLYDENEKTYTVKIPPINSLNAYEIKIEHACI
jgi:hypothetical protein